MFKSQFHDIPDFPFIDAFEKQGHDECMDQSYFSSIVDSVSKAFEDLDDIVYLHHDFGY